MYTLYNGLHYSYTYTLFTIHNRWRILQPSEESSMNLFLNLHRCTLVILYFYTSLLIYTHMYL